jgi:hypothetical protein
MTLLDRAPNRVNSIYRPGPAKEHPRVVGSQIDNQFRNFVAKAVMTFALIA